MSIILSVRDKAVYVPVKTSECRERKGRVDRVLPNEKTLELCEICFHIADQIKVITLGTRSVCGTSLKLVNPMTKLVNTTLKVS